MSKITNTATQERVITDAFPDSIYASEARGQRELVMSTQLPVVCHGQKEELVRAGVIFGEPCEDDSLFCEATLPDGWTKRPTDHSMWSELVDGDGKVRARIFYKAAFYDRVAHMRVSD